MDLAATDDRMFVSVPAAEMQEIERLVPDNTDVWIGLNDRDTEGGCGADDFKCVRCSKLLFWVALFCLLTSDRAQNG